MMDTYVINLDKDLEKWQQIQHKFSWKLTRVSAIDGGGASGRPVYTNKHIYGCLMSHRKVWGVVVKTGRPSLVLEDDCHPVEGFEEKLKSLIETLPRDYDVAVVGYIASDVSRDYLVAAISSPLMKRRCMRKVNKDWYVPGVFVGTHCYIVSPKGAQKLLNNHTVYHADFIINSNKDLILYCPKETIASQTHKHKPLLMYNQHISWEWILLEPALGVGSITIRNIHLLFIYCLFVCLSATSGSYIFLKLLIASPLAHYLSTIGHISHNLKYGKTIEDAVYDNKKKQSHTLNDIFYIITLLVLFWCGVKKNVLMLVVDVFLFLIIIRTLIIHFFPIKDPSGVCEEKSVHKYSLFEYCGSSRFSGYITPSVLLACIQPRLGVFFVVIQTMLIINTQSHYTSDILFGVLLTIFIFYIYQKIVNRKRIKVINKKK